MVEQNCKSPVQEAKEENKGATVRGEVSTIPLKGVSLMT
jgi:hypothetical protein